MRSVKKQVGVCRLCKQHRNLRNSHIWPSFGYRDFVSDRETGGAFINLETNRFFPKQIKRYWYCNDCEQVFSRGEKYAKEMLAEIDEQNPSPTEYDERFHAFCTSISLRTLEYCGGIKSLPKRSEVKSAHKYWRDYLLGNRSDVLPFSMHCFLLFDKDLSMHKAMGGHVFHEKNLILSQVGPLFIVALLSRRQLSIGDLDIWSQSLVSAKGETLMPWKEWRPNGNITDSFFDVLVKHQREVVERVTSRTWGLDTEFTSG
ncbi:hypothetical protein LF1_11190 [Rubripirellula obstinata]|uniref:Uncharacterized protein n=1 Tax=Rubripirellula obstinata TaxID=406547 RepID=A0A5B1CBV3_9BACT|nr:hypothetical protein [Rubripirellula obstinata]KAA1258597.1 hypothetical protein LF1_11190 [Rubripirellula obstinata]